MHTTSVLCCQMTRHEDSSCFNMTKLMQWVICGVIFFGVWFPLATNKLSSKVLQNYSDIIVLFPVIAVAFFMIYAATVIMYRIVTFNNCEGAAEELQSQIKEARKDLMQKGFIFK